MRLGALFSGGKDSCLALAKASEANEVCCLITIHSDNPESYMFHTPNIWVTKLQAEALGIPLFTAATPGEKDLELIELKAAINESKEKYKLAGIATGAIRSEYQASRIQKICTELGLECINPLWHMDQVQELNELVQSGYKVIISGVFAYPLGKELLGKEINAEVIAKLSKLEEQYQINPAGEGGEIETTVIDCPLFSKRIVIEESEINYQDNAGTYTIKKARLAKK